MTTITSPAINVYTDGGSLGNQTKDKRGYVSLVIEYKGTVQYKVERKQEGAITNQCAELVAVFRALEWINSQPRKKNIPLHFTFHTDSLYAVGHSTGSYKTNRMPAQNLKWRKAILEIIELLETKNIFVKFEKIDESVVKGILGH